MKNIRNTLVYKVLILLIGLFFLWIAYFNFQFEDFGLGQLLFFGLGGIAMVIESVRLLRK